MICVISIIILLLVAGISIISFWQTNSSFVQNDDKNLDWGLIIAYSLLFGSISASIFLIVFIQLYKVKQRKSMWHRDKSGAAARAASTGT